VKILGVRVDEVTVGDVLAAVDEFIEEGGRRTIMYANVHVVNTAQRDPELMEILGKADLVYPDGHGVVLGARLLGHDLPPRMTGADWIHDLCAHAAQRKYSLYVVAGEPGVAERACGKLAGLYEGPEVLGTSDGFFHRRGETAKLIEDINEKKPDIVLVGMGTPLQEKFVAESRDLIEAPVCWVVGALFDYVAGRMRRGPRWMLDHGMEWLCRLVFEPRRLWKRYLIGNTLFLARILLSRFRG